MIQSPPRIDLLPENLIDQIKAGEVIERPGSLIKEILENAVDAGSKKLELTLKNNGLDLISLKDNGHGMGLADLPLAFSRHATSKISRFEDLYHLRSFGFRGEALASIAAISKLQCISFTANSEKGSEIRIEGGHTLFHGERLVKSYPHGTELVIQDLFFNTPARLKFIQSQTSEKTFIKKIIHAFILSHPQVEFHVRWDDEEKDIYPASENLQQRLESMAPKSQGLILHSEKFYENNEVDLYLIPGHVKVPLKWQHLFINDRFILDKQLQRVLSNALISSFGTDDFHYIAFFNLPSDNIDVNVHPNKTIIKCFEISKLISLLTSTVKELGAHKKPQSLHSDPQIQREPSFLGSLDESPTLLQERHEYNMDGIFSPHRIDHSSSDKLVWIGNYFLKKETDRTHAVSAIKLLEAFVHFKMSGPALTIPLLVSEPFPSAGLKEVNIQKLMNSSFEFDYLGPETLVMRGIPEWMNGFPLKEMTTLLLKGESFASMTIHPQDWAQTTWEEMLEIMRPHLLKDQKVFIDLENLLSEKLR